MEYLRSEKTILIEDTKDISHFANEVEQAKQGVCGIVSEKRKANVFCHQGSRRVTSFILYDDTSIETEQKQRIKYRSALQSLRTLTPQIQPFELRMHCAANLRNLRYRLLFYDRAEKSRVLSYSDIKLENPNKYSGSDKTVLENWETLEEDLDREAELAFETFKRRMRELRSNINLVYPVPRIWCDAMESAFVGSFTKGKWHDLRMKVYVCPGVSEGRSTYALNPNCKPDSPPDMVLLFETRASWNQHGGPELFTLDNNDPKDGCVLLNGGTVKFIRAEEELHQLRWK